MLELTVAMAFVGLLATGIALSISTCLNVWTRATQIADVNQEARVVLELVSRDIRTSYSGIDKATGYTAGGTSGGSSGRVDVLETAAQNTRPARLELLPDELRAEWDQQSAFPVSDYALVRYQWMQKTAERPAGLYRITSVVPLRRGDQDQAGATGEPTLELLSTSVVGLRYEYYDGREEEWVESWDSREMPDHPLRAVWVELTLRDPREQDHVFETTVPVLSQ